MSAPFVLAVPSKGRLQENAEGFFARAGLQLVKPRGAREYRGAIAGMPGVEVAYLSASDITTQLGLGAVHFGVTGEDQIREMYSDAESARRADRQARLRRGERRGRGAAGLDRRAHRWRTSTMSRPRSAPRMTARCASPPST